MVVVGPNVSDATTVVPFHSARKPPTNAGLEIWERSAPAVSDVIWFIVRWSLRLIPLILVAAVLHYNLPGHDVVRVVGTEVTRMDQAARSADQPAGETATPTLTRDVRFINAVRPNGKPAVYRNEDTDWGFPWYFKFDSGNLQALAQDLVSTQATPRWAVITHYGWRIEIFSMFPNAVDIEEVEGPDVTVIPWFTIVFLVLLAGLLIYLRILWLRFLERLEFDYRFENASNSAAQIWRWIKANLRDARDRLTGRA